MKIAAIIQARMGSSRLPGKVLLELRGRSVLERVVQRASRISRASDLLVATTLLAEDRAIEEECSRLGVECFRGASEDVLDRYLQAASLAGAEAIVRLTADCPLLDPAHVDNCIASFRAQREVNYVTTGGTFPEGYSAEVFSLATLSVVAANATLPSEREHVTPFIRKNPSRFNIYRVELAQDLSPYRLTIDEPADVDVLSAVIDALEPDDRFFGLAEAVAFLRANPEIAALNSHIPRQAGYRESLREEQEELDDV